MAAAREAIEELDGEGEGEGGRRRHGEGGRLRADVVRLSSEGTAESWRVEEGDPHTVCGARVPH